MLSSPACAALNVFACEPEWGALAQELGGDKVSVFSATTALQDPHRIEARPSLIARVAQCRHGGLLPARSSRSAGCRCCSRNRATRGSSRARPGYIEASQYVAKLEVPKVVDRSLGDIHPAAIRTSIIDPRNIAKVADVLAERLAQIDPANAAYYQARARIFGKRWQQAIAALGAAGCAAQGRADRCATIRTFVPHRLGSACAKSAASNRSPGFRRRRRISPSWWSR